MPNLRAFYKSKTVAFGNINERRILRAAQQVENRRGRRSAEFSNRRIVETHEVHEVKQAQPGAVSKQPEDRRTKLLRWKLAKEQQKKIAMQNKLPAFRTGVVQHRFDSPKFLHQLQPTVKPEPVEPRITRATAKRIKSKQNALLKEKAHSKIPEQPLNARNISFAPQNHQFRAPEGLPDLPLFGAEAVAAAENRPTTVPVYFSPYVVTARGKAASRKEQLQNMELEEYKSRETESKETDGQSTLASIHKAESNVPVDCESSPLTTSHFRKITEKEVVRLRALCDRWMQIMTDNKIPEDAQLVINQTVGQTNLLINKKIEQFKQLIVECETGCGEHLVTCQDLQGFWEMMYMQVENCDSRFSKLDRLQERNWEEDDPVISTKIVTSKKPGAKKKVLPSKSSSVRDMIRAARKKQMESQENARENLPAVIVEEPRDASPDDSARLLAVKFDGGFFVVESPRKSVTPRKIKNTPNSQQRVFSDDASRRSALNLLRLSQRLKPPEATPVTVETDPTILYVNSQQIPCKSILKRIGANETPLGTASKRSQNKVIFSKNREISENNLSWFDENAVSDVQEIVRRQTIAIRKKLYMGDDSDVEVAEDEEEEKSKTSGDLRVNLFEEKVIDNPENVSDRTLTSCKTNTSKQDKLPDSARLSEGEDSDNSSGNARRTRQGVVYNCGEEIVAKFSNFQVTEPDAQHPKANFTETNGHKKEKETLESLESLEETKPRRSHRRSVRFTGEDCTGCSAGKPVYPVTPRAKRKSNKLLKTPNVEESLTENTKARTPSSQESEDLISWDTPKDVEAVPARVRRSLRLQNRMQP